VDAFSFSHLAYKDGKPISLSRSKLPLKHLFQFVLGQKISHKNKL
jgi:hypothetical protein